MVSNSNRKYSGKTLDEWHLEWKNCREVLVPSTTVYTVFLVCGGPI